MKLSLLPLVLLAVPFASAQMKRVPNHARLGRRLSASVASGSVALNVTTPPSVAAAWYAGWSSTNYPPSEISYEEYTHLTYSFAVTTSDVNTLSLADSDEEVLPEFVQGCHDNGVKALVSIGGWTGSRFFSDHVATEANRAAFVKTVVNLATKYKLDGLDFDWEYPNKQGIGCNKISPNDTPNFLLFLQALRADPIGKTLIVTAAVGDAPFAGANGSPSTSVGEFAKVLDYIALMNYDIWGKWSDSVGPNAPLDDACASPDKQQGSATAAVAAWTKAGMPAGQIVLGVPAYGHSFSVSNANAFVSGSQTTLAAYPPFDKANQPTGDDGDAPLTNVCGVEEGLSGGFHFRSLIADGFLGEDGKVAPGMAYRFDDCSKTAYVYNPKTQVMVSYDDADSFAAKGTFIKDQGLLGWAMWESGGDYDDILVESIRKAVGFSQPAQCRRL